MTALHTDSVKEYTIPQLAIHSRRGTTCRYCSFGAVSCGAVSFGAVFCGAVSCGAVSCGAVYLQPSLGVDLLKALAPNLTHLQGVSLWRSGALAGQGCGWFKPQPRQHPFFFTNIHPQPGKRQFVKKKDKLWKKLGFRCMVMKKRLEQVNFLINWVLVFVCGVCMEIAWPL